MTYKTAAILAAESPLMGKFTGIKRLAKYIT
jgi:hypothetical protein